MDIRLKRAPKRPFRKELRVDREFKRADERRWLESDRGSSSWTTHAGTTEHAPCSCRCGLPRAFEGDGSGSGGTKLERDVQP